MRFLIVEDDDGVAEGTATLLAENGHESVRAAHAQAGLEILRTQPVEIILLDINLPGGLSGYAACETYRAFRPELPIILISGAFTSEADARLAERVGASGFLCKPFDKEQLFAVVERARGEARARPAAALGFSCEECGAEGRVRVGEGDAVRVRCPNCGSIRVVRRADLLPVADARRSLVAPGLRRRVLVVDNAEHFRLYLLDLLTEAGHYVVTARGGQEAFTLAQEWMPDLVVTDLLLPGMDGLTLCQRLKAHPRLSRTPVVLVTSLKNEEYRRQAEAAGIDLIQAKPIQADSFLESIHALIARPLR
jgi:CheY-like chemotaxis protein/DNA-directed RNA polymerase subunit RPC12/RpoP